MGEINNTFCHVNSVHASDLLFFCLTDEDEDEDDEEDFEDDDEWDD